MATPIGRKITRKRGGRKAVGSLAVLLAVLVPAAISWACNPQAYLRLDQPTYSPSGQMQVSGAFFKSDTQLTLSVEPGGEVAKVTTSSNGSFTTRITAPSTAGSYTLSAVGYENGAVINGLPARASFSVGTAASRPAPGSSSPQPGASQPGTSQPGATAPSPGRFAEPEVPRTRAFASPERRSSGARQPARRGADRAAAVNTGAGVITPATSTGSSGAVFAGSVARADRVAAASGGKSGAVKSTGGRKTAGSSAASALGEDAWSGFESGKAPGLLSGGSSAVADGGAGPQLGWGLGLLAVGLLALVGGLTVAEARRRRAER